MEKYILFMIIAIALFLTDYILIHKQKKIVKLKSNKPFYKKFLFNLQIKSSKIFSGKMAIDKNSKEYKQLTNELSLIGFKINPETFYILSVIIAAVGVLFYIALSYLNKVNMLVRYDELKQAAAVLDDPNIAQISFTPDMGNAINVFLLLIFLPRLIVKIVFKIKSSINEKEIFVLQTYVLTMIKAGTNVKQMLINLSSRAMSYKPYFELCVKQYSTDPEGELEKLKNSVQNEDFKKLIVAIEQCLKNDRETSYIFLLNHRKMALEITRLRKIKKDANRKVIGVLMLFLPLIAFALVAGYPWLVFAMKVIQSAPI